VQQTVIKVEHDVSVHVNHFSIDQNRKRPQMGSRFSDAQTNTHAVSHRRSKTM
jgi:hypothetical protein